MSSVALERGCARTLSLSKGGKLTEQLEQGKEKNKNMQLRFEKLWL
jgi:hypothetical protein